MSGQYTVLERELFAVLRVENSGDSSYYRAPFRFNHSVAEHASHKLSWQELEL